MQKLHLKLRIIIFLFLLIFGMTSNINAINTAASNPLLKYNPQTSTLQIKWGDNGTLVSNATGDQFESAITSDGAGGAIIVWKDQRGSDADLYAQKFNSEGIPLWTLNGTVVCNATGDQNNPVIVSDNEGGAIIAWSDTRKGNGDIYALRIDSNGKPVWATPNGTLVCNETNDQINPQVVSDGNSGVIISWMDYRNGLDWNIYGRRICRMGCVFWNANGTLIINAIGNQNNISMVKNGLGGAILTWMDYRNPSYSSIYAQQINYTGLALWDTNGITISNATGNQYNPALVNIGAGGAIITWFDERSGSQDIYAQRVNIAGATFWTNNGTAIANLLTTQDYPRISSDGAGGAIIAWQDSRNGNTDIYAQRINANGNTLWIDNGTAVCTALLSQENLRMVEDGTGGVVIAWEDGRNSNTDIFSQRIDSNGDALWSTPNGTAICNVDGTQDEISIVGDSTGGTFMSWSDFRSSDTQDIYASKIFDYTEDTTSGSSDDDDDDDEDLEQEAIPFGIFYLFFTLLSIISIIILIKHKTVQKK